MQYNVERNGFTVVREFVGHGIGRTMHEDPKVPNFVTGEQLRGDFRLQPGMTFAVEPMVVAGRRDVNVLPDEWTMVTEDGKPAAHFEHTVAVTEHGVDVLTDGRAPFSLDVAKCGASAGREVAQITALAGVRRRTSHLRHRVFPDIDNRFAGPEPVGKGI